MASEKYQYAALLESQHGHTLLARTFQPLTWLHPLWVAEVLPDDFPLDPTCIKTNQFVSKQLALPDIFDIELKSEYAKLLLLAPSLLAKIIGVLGLCCYQLSLQKLISKHVKAEIDRQLGCHAVKIVMQKLPFMLSDFPSELQIKNVTFTSSYVLPNFINQGLNVFRRISNEDANYQLLCFMLSPRDNEVTDVNRQFSKETCQKTILLMRKLAVEIDPSCSNLLK